MAAILLPTPSPVAAQSSPPRLPPTREEVTRPQTPLQPPPSRLQVEGGIERAPCALDNPAYASIRFTLRAVDFEGLRGIDSGALADSYAGMVGRDLPVSAICEIRDRAGTMLRQAGYIAAVEVPEQRIADGTVRFRVLMARLVQIRVRGDAGRAEQTIAGYLEKLQGQPVFNRFEAERYLLLASDLPGYNVRLALRPAGTGPGEVVGEVTVVRLAGVLDANVQNFGSRELGRFGGLLRGQMFGLTGLGDRTTATVFTTSDLKEQQTLQLGHDLRIGGEGLSAGGMVTFAWARPELGPDADVKARTFLATAELGYPFIRRQTHTVRGALGLDIANQDVRLNGVDLTRDRLRVAFARMTADATSMGGDGFSPAEPRWRANGLVEVRRGLDILGATERCGDTVAACSGADFVEPSRIDADGTATVVRTTVAGEFRPRPRMTLAAVLLGQYSNDPLLSFEEFSGGNYTAGRGYDPGSVIGDRGFGFQLEARAGSQIPATRRSIAAEPYLFYDYAQVTNADRLAIDHSATRLSSVGGGVRATWGDKMRLDLTFAVPLKKVGLLDKRPDPRILLSLTTRLWPWSFRK